MLRQQKKRYNSGLTKSIGNILNNRKSGIWYYYLKDGQIDEYGSYSSGLRVGNWFKFNWANGRILIHKYLHGKKVRSTSPSNIRRKHLLGIPAPIPESISQTIHLTERLSKYM